MAYASQLQHPETVATILWQSARQPHKRLVISAINAELEIPLVTYTTRWCIRQMVTLGHGPTAHDQAETRAPYMGHEQPLCGGQSTNHMTAAGRTHSELRAH